MHLHAAPFLPILCAFCLLKWKLQQKARNQGYFQYFERFEDDGFCRGYLIVGHVSVLAKVTLKAVTSSLMLSRK